MHVTDIVVPPPVMQDPGTVNWQVMADPALLEDASSGRGSGPLE